MLLSMTGFGKAETQYADKKIIAEIKCLNSKQLDIHSRLSTSYREKEIELRNLVSAKLLRGKIEFNLNYEYREQAEGASINESLLLQYFRKTKEIASREGIEVTDNLFQALIRLPDVVVPQAEEITEEEWSVVFRCTEDAVHKVIEFRKQEGKTMEKDIKKRVSRVTELIPEIEQMEAERMDQLKNRLRQNLKELTTGLYDENRMEQEILHYLEKLDINEEKVRLKNHCEYFLQSLQSKEPPGKKLGFITQEMGREINTLGSKAGHSGIQRSVVMMKDELEKIKEQLMNVL